MSAPGRPILRLAAIALGSLAALGVVLAAVNYARLGGSQFGDSAERLLARARRLNEQARPTYQEEALAELGANPMNGPVVRLDDERAHAIRTQVGEGLSPEEVARMVRGFEFERTEPAELVARSEKLEPRVADGVLQVTHHGDGYLSNVAGLGLVKRDVAEIMLRVRVQKGNEMWLGWHDEAEASEPFYRRVTVDLIPDGEFHTYVVDASSALQRGTLDRFNREIIASQQLDWISLRPSNVEGDEVEIDFIRFVSKLASYQREPIGITHESIGGVERRALYVLPSQALEYVVRVPEKSPRLRFGVSMLPPERSAESPASFEVRLDDAGAQTELFRHTLGETPEWHDTELDLTPWAGREVRLTLTARGRPDTVALWSNPTIYGAPERRFNVVLILEDTLRADHLSVLGYDRRHTSPFKEKLAEHAVLFDNAFSQATKTRPSVPSIHTSLVPTATGVWWWSDMLREEYLTLAEVLRSQGFTTGSFIQNMNAGSHAGMQQGFETVFDTRLLGESTAAILGDRLTTWLTANREKNFFINIHIIDPHGPYDPPKPFDAWYRESGDAGAEVEKNGEFDPDWQQRPTGDGRRALYDGEIANNDQLLERFFARLDELGLRQDTLIVFLSDHGEYLGERGFWGHHPPGFLPVLHVPLVLAYPARWQGPRRFRETVQNIDVMPTVLELAGVDNEKLLLQGDSLVGLVEGRDTELWANRIALSEEEMQMKTKGEPCGCGSLFYRQWHLISSPTFVPSDLGLVQMLALQVHDFHDDPAELTRLNTFLPDLATKLRFYGLVNELQANTMGAWEKWTGGVSETVSFDPTEQDRLKALGYIQ